MKKVLIIFPISHQAPLMLSICKHVSCSSLMIHALDIDKWVLYDEKQSTQLFPFYALLLKKRSSNKILNRFFLYFQLLIHLIVDRFLIKSVIKEYDIIDFHYLCDIYYPLIPIVSRMGKKIKINLWGSDLFRVGVKEQERQYHCFKLANLVQVSTKPMFLELQKRIPEFSNKILVQHFGNQVLTDDLNMLNDNIDISFLPNYSSSKITVTCGYNGSSGQQHKAIISMLNNLPKGIQEKLYLLFPMTYGGDKDYIKEIKKMLNNSCYSFDVIDTRLTNRQVFDIRRVTDVVINIQITDAFSSSLQEHLLCTNILLVGDWLPYEILDENGIIYYKSSVASLQKKILYILNNINDIKIVCADNKDKINKLVSWDHVSEKWKSIYESL